MCPDGPERKLAAILSADVVGYSRLMAEDEAGTIQTLKAYRSLISSLVHDHRGRVVDSPGDNLLAEFPNALDAVQCAVEVQGVLRVRNQTLPENRRMLFRIGIHLGDITTEGDHVYGDGVNIAARLECLADAGGICISGNVYDLVHGKIDLGFEDLGAQSLKNIPDPVGAYRVEMDHVATAEVRPRGGRPPAIGAAAALLLGAALALWWIYGPPRRPVPATDAIRSIAVLPLENLSGDPEQEYFADGMTEALIGDLAKIRALSVISRTSVMPYKNTDKALPEIAQELNVDAIVEGTVMRVGDRVRITTQLIDARNDRHLWNDRYDRELRDILALHSEVAQAVAEQVRLELTSEEQAALTVSRTVEPRAYDAYVRGIQLGAGIHEMHRAQGAIKQFERAIELDPDFAEAYAALARARNQLGTSLLSLRFRSELAQAREDAERALEIDDRQSGAHAMLGLARMWHDWDFVGAGRELARAVELSPSDPIALIGYAVYQRIMGRHEKGIDATDRLLRIAPFDPSFRDDRIWSFVYARQYGRALEEIEAARQLAMGFEHYAVGDAYEMLGWFEEAHRAYLAADVRCGAPCAWSGEARKRGWAEGGREGEWRAWLKAATEIEGFSPWLIGVWYGRIGETDEAFTWLERGYRERDPLMAVLKASPQSDPIRSDPRFDDLLRRIGFPEG